MVKICKFYVKGNCKDGNECKFEHEDGICKFHFFGTCKNGDECEFKHTAKLQNNNKKKHVKNTETFKPSHEPADMNVILGNPNDDTFERVLDPRDIVVVPNLFCEVNDESIYEKLLEEIKATGKEEEGLWK